MGAKLRLVCFQGHPTHMFSRLLTTFHDNLRSQDQHETNYIYTAVSRNVVGKKRTRQSRKVIWDMISKYVPDTVAVEPTFVAFF